MDDEYQDDQDIETAEPIQEDEVQGIAYPEQYLIEDLMSKNEGFKPTTMADDFYSAGPEFPAGVYLREREIEKGRTPAGTKMREARLEASTFEPILSGMIDFMIGALVKSKLSVLSDGDEKYWSAVNKEIARTQKDISRFGVLHNRSFGLLSMPPRVQNSVENQRLAGELIPTITFLNANMVYDWEENPDGSLKWAKTYTYSNERADPNAIWGPPDQQVHEWVFFTASEIVTYRTILPIEKGKTPALDPNALADMIPEESMTHDFKVCPIFRFTPSVQVINNLLPITDSHFNRTSSITYALDTTAWSLPMIASDKPYDEILATESAVLLLEKGGSTGQLGPNQAQNFAALQDDASHLYNALFAVLQASSLNSSQPDQNTSRLSYLSRQHEAGFMEVLLAGLAVDLERFYRSITDAIQDLIGDESTLTFSGCDDYNATTLDAYLEFVKKLMGVDVGDSTKKFALADLSRKVTAGADDSTRAEVAKENQKLDISKIEADDSLINDTLALKNSGIITVNEARARLGMGPLPEPVMEVEQDKPEEVKQDDPKPSETVGESPNEDPKQEDEKPQDEQA